MKRAAPLAQPSRRRSSRRAAALGTSVARGRRVHARRARRGAASPAFMPPGAEIAGAYMAQMRERCEAYRGRILVADTEGEIAGYVMVWTRVRSGELDDGDLEHGLVADLVVREPFRGRGIGRELLAAAEAHAATCGVRWLRIDVLAANRPARGLYAARRFSDYELRLERRLAPLGERSPWRVPLT